MAGNENEGRLPRNCGIPSAEELSPVVLAASRLIVDDNVAILH
jgi:hypothetical protein